MQALWSLGRSALKTRGLTVAALACAALSAAGVNELALLFGAGGTGALGRRLMRRAQAPAALLLTPVPSLGLGVLATVQPFQLATLFLVFLKVGAVLFGSGYVLLAFLRSELVVRLGWKHSCSTRSRSGR